jgi:hypothetical protein
MTCGWTFNPARLVATVRRRSCTVHPLVSLSSSIFFFHFEKPETRLLVPRAGKTICPKVQSVTHLVFIIETIIDACNTAKCSRAMV